MFYDVILPLVFPFPCPLLSFEPANYCKQNMANLINFFDHLNDMMSAVCKNTVHTVYIHFLSIKLLPSTCLVKI